VEAAVLARRRGVGVRAAEEREDLE